MTAPDEITILQARDQHRHRQDASRSLARYHARRAVCAADPMRCSHCFAPHDRAASGTKQCAACLGNQAKHRQRRKEARAMRPVTVREADLSAITKRLASLELAVARLQLARETNARSNFNKGWKRGRMMGQLQAYREQAAHVAQNYVEAMPRSAIWQKKHPPK
jgi:hypothetical protein